MITIELINILDQMKNKPINNYVLAGLCSSLIGGEGFGTVRYFEKERHQHDFITPHNHRFDFACIVLEGYVTNRLWKKSTALDGDLYNESTLECTGNMGVCSHGETIGQHYYLFSDITYLAGEMYSMKYDEIHSIVFSRGAKLLFFEGPTKVETVTILEPVIDGKVIKTCINQPWMFT